MSLVKVQKKGQLTLPVRLRNKAGIAEGDVLEAKLERGKITLSRKSRLDRGIAESLEDFRKGRAYGPFSNAEEMIASLHRNVKKLRATKRL